MQYTARSPPLARGRLKNLPALPGKASPERQENRKPAWRRDCSHPFPPVNKINAKRLLAKIKKKSRCHRISEVKRDKPPDACGKVQTTLGVIPPRKPGTNGRVARPHRKLDRLVRHDWQNALGLT